VIVQALRSHWLSNTTDASFRFCSFDGSYWSDAQRLYASIQQHAESEDFDALKKDAHTLKGSSRMIKAERFGEACYALELAAKQDDQVEDVLKNFNAEFEELQQLIQQKL
jgi:HPt (histidine-containing phosphotransfer) domain-containing protein